MDNQNIILKYKNILEKNSLFEKIQLKKWDILIKEWEKDQNIYFLLDWELIVEKFTTNEKNEVKQLAVIEKWAIIWEWAFKRNTAKEVSIKANSKVELLKINAKEWFLNFVKKEPKIWLEILVEIIDISNKRLLESNNRLTSILKMSEEIANMENYDNKNIFLLIDSFSKIIWVDYILYLERNPIMKNYMTIKYDTRLTWKMQDIIVDLWEKKLDIEDIRKTWIKLTKYNISKQLKNWNKIIWYFIFWRVYEKFTELDFKNIIPISNMLAWVLKQKEYIEEQKNRDYLENN
jgi:hypothetical protein